MADDEVTDLTEDGDSGAADTGKKKGKAPKEPKAPKEKKEKAPKEKKSQSGGGAGGIIVIMILVLIILIGGFGAALYLDMFSAREIVAEIVTEPLLGIITWLDPGYSSIEQRQRAEAEAQERKNAARELELDEREANIELMEAILDTREALLDRRDAEQDRREEQIIAMYERTVPLYRRELTDEVLEEMNTLARTYTNMSPETAAGILVRLYDIRDVASILWYMSERNAAALLAAFTPEYAAEITELWLYN